MKKEKKEVKIQKKDDLEKEKGSSSKKNSESKSDSKKDVKSKNSAVARKKKQEDKYKVVDSGKMRKVEIVVTSVIGVIFLILLFFAITDEVFIPAALISFAMLLFCICYYYIENESKKKMVYILFSLGVLLIVIEVIFTLIKVY